MKEFLSDYLELYSKVHSMLHQVWGGRQFAVVVCAVSLLFLSAY
jgi:hypothetical protein